MKRLIVNAKNAGGIPVELEGKDYEEFKKRILTALRKFSSSRKTRNVHHLLDKNLVHLIILSGDAAKALTVLQYKNTVLRAIFLNVYQFDNSLAGKGAVAKATALEALDKKIQKESTFVNEKRILNIEKLQEQREELLDKFLTELDYVKIVDGLYFGWLQFLAYIAIEQDSAGKPKIVATAAEILASIIKRLFQQVKQGKIENEEHQLIEAIAYYFINIYYYGESSQYTINKLKQAFSEEIIDALKRAKVTKFDHFNDLAKVLSGTELMPMTPETFDLQMKRMFGQYAYEEYIQKSLMDYLAVMANLAHPSDLFKDAFPVDEKLHQRLEELLLNEKKHITISST
jgi:hypothetical protein